MTYDETEELFKAMNHIETYTRLHRAEMDKTDIDWENVAYCMASVKEARETIFKIATSGKEDV